MALFRSHFNASVLLPNNAYGSPARSLRTSMHFSGDTSSLRFGWQTSVFRRQKHWRGNTCYTKAALNHGTLQWVSAVASAALMFSKGTAIQKSFLVPIFALQAPPAVISWIKAPYEAIDLRGSQAGMIVALAAVIYVAFQHFSKSGSLEKAFDQVSFIATLAIICLASVSCLLLF